MYAQFINNKTIKPAGDSIKLNETIYTVNIPQEVYNSAGYYLVQEEEIPKYTPRQEIEPNYTLTENTIVNSWEVIDKPPPYIDRHVLDSMEGIVNTYEEGLSNKSTALDAMEAIVEMYELILGG